MQIELLDNGDFTAQGLWSFSGDFTYPATDQYRTASPSLRLDSDNVGGTPVNAEASQPVPVVKGTDITVAGFLRPSSGGDASSTISVWVEEGAPNFTVHQLTGDLPYSIFLTFYDSWFPLVRKFVPTADTTATLFIKNSGSSGLPEPLTGTTWHADDFSMSHFIRDGDGFMKGKWDSMTKLIELLKGQIVGAPGFYHDLEGRVFNRLITPGEHDDLKLPFLCVPLIEEAQTYPVLDRLTQTQWEATVYAFASDRLAHDMLDSEGPRDISHLHDDVVKAFLSDCTLGKTLNAPITILSCNSISGTDDEAYSEFQMRIQLALNFSKDDLGPGL